MCSCLFKDICAIIFIVIFCSGKQISINKGLVNKLWNINKLWWESATNIKNEAYHMCKGIKISKIY